MPSDPETPPGLRAALLIGATGFGYLLVRDGSPGWQVVRAAAVVASVAALLHLCRHRRGRPTGVVVWAAGALLVAVGLGIALPHLTKTGVSTTGVAGLVVLGAGVVVVGYGTAWLLRGSGRWQRPPLVAGLLVGLFVAVWAVGQPVAATNVPRTDLGSRTPGDLGLPHREVELPAADGVRLSAWYVPSRNGAAVVLLHGAGSTRTAVLDQAAVLAAHGYGLLLLDARGHGRSGGRAMDFGWYGDADVSGAITYLAARPDVDDDRIAVLGLSMGGEEAIGAAAADPRVAAVVAEGATTRVAADKAWLSAEHGWRGTAQRGLEWLTYRVTDLLTEASPPMSLRDAARAAAPTPMLLIAGGAVPDEAPAARYIAAGAPGSVTVWVAPGADHTGALARHPDEWEARVTAFLAEALLPGGPAR